jgi:hypothetical protein
MQGLQAVNPAEVRFPSALVTLLAPQIAELAEGSQGTPLPEGIPRPALVGRSVAFVLLEEVDVDGDIVYAGLHTGRCAPIRPSCIAFKV